MAMTETWQLQTQIDAVIFDCDGTLSHIEGINRLAEINGVANEVKQLTEKAMSETGMSPELYQQRLDLVKPTKEQILALGEDYFKNRTEDIFDIIQAFKSLNKEIYIISSGILDALAIFGDLLSIPIENIFAVDLSYDSKGNYLDFNHASPLVTNSGKKTILDRIKITHPNVVFVGDGMNDIVVLNSVKRFVGYGGSFPRESIARLCQFYIRDLSISPLLPLTLTKNEITRLTEQEQHLYQKGLSIIQQNLVCQ